MKADSGAGHGADMGCISASEPEEKMMADEVLDQAKFSQLDLCAGLLAR
jgi:hypothetical protein